MTTSTGNVGTSLAARRAKRTFDLLFAGSALIAFSPFFLVFAIGAKFSTGGTALLPVVRLGERGKPFRMYKFRTMRVEASSEPIVSAAVEKDARITKFGKFLRKTSLNELPQFFNVLIGDMSIVGPRAAVLLEAEHYSDEERRRLVVKPGITGLWQVRRGPGLGTKDMIRHDLEYIDNWSFWLDMKIVWITAVKGVAGTSSY